MPSCRERQPVVNDNDDRRSPVAGPQARIATARATLPAVEAARQADVGEDQADAGRRRDRRQGLRAVTCHDDGVAQFLQHLGAEFADRFVILDQQDQFAAIAGGNGFLASRLLGHRLAARGH